jgi:hypothetical protein
MAEPALIVRSFAVGKRTVTLTLPRPRPGGVLAIACEWDPSMPRNLSEREIHQYRAGRDATLAEAARLLNSNTLLIEV